MRAGELKYVITFKKAVKGKDEFGSSVKTWTDFLTVPAAMKYNSGKREEDNHKATNAKSLYFQVRFNPAITEELQILFSGKLYEIESINPLGFREGLEITANLIN